MDGQGLHAGQHLARAVVNRMTRFTSDYDVIVTPTAGVGVSGLHPGTGDDRYLAGGWYAWQRFRFPVNLTGQPVVTVPAGVTRDGSRWGGIW